MCLPTLPTIMANSVSQSSLLESFESKIKVEPGQTTLSDVLIKREY
jgi:hypothetical protein